MTAWAQQLVSLQDEDNCLILPERPPVYVPPDLRFSLHIRRCYRKLLDHLRSRAANAGHPVGFIVTGTPGIGTSAFALYLLWQLGKLRHIVYYQHDNAIGVRILLKFDFSKEQVVVHKLGLSVFDEDFESSNAWYIMEGAPLLKPFTGVTTTVVLSSPHYPNFHRFMKGRYCERPILYLPSWSLEELQACRQSLYPKVQAGTVAERYSWLGGTIRSVLIKTGESAEEVVRAALRRSALSAQQLVDAVRTAESHKEEFSHTLVHYRAGSDFQLRYVTFASPLVADLVLERLAKELEGSLQKFLVASADEPNLAGLRGLLFERHGHKVFQLDGTAYRWRQLEQPMRKRSCADANLEDTHEDSDAASINSIDEELEDADAEVFEASHHYGECVGHLRERLGVQEVDRGDVQQQLQQLCIGGSRFVPSQLTKVWDDGAQPLGHLSSSNVYITPRSSNNASWDAVLMNGSTPLILQYTVSREHGIKAAQVQKLLNRLDPELRQAAQLVFVVPPRIFDTFPWQAWQTTKGDVMARVPPVLRQMQQWVMVLKVPPSQQSINSSGSSGSMRTSAGGKGSRGSGARPISTNPSGAAQY